MVKDDDLVVQETREIVELLPDESRFDIELVKAIAGSLREGQDRHVVQIKALELAHQRLESKVDKGFELVASEFQKVRHEAEKDRIRADHTREMFQQTRAIAEQSWAKIQEVAIGVAKAEAKAEGARDLAKESRKGFGIDPAWAMVFTAALIFIVLAAFTRVERVEKPSTVKESQGSVIKCGVDVTCNYTGTPRPIPSPSNYGGV